MMMRLTLRRQVAPLPGVPRPSPETSPRGGDGTAALEPPLGPLGAAAMRHWHAAAPGGAAGRRPEPGRAALPPRRSAPEASALAARPSALEASAQRVPARLDADAALPPHLRAAAGRGRPLAPPFACGPTLPPHLRAAAEAEAEAEAAGTDLPLGAAAPVPGPVAAGTRWPHTVEALAEVLDVVARRPPRPPPPSGRAPLDADDVDQVSEALLVLAPRLVLVQALPRLLEPPHVFALEAFDSLATARGLLALREALQPLLAPHGTCRVVAALAAGVEHGRFALPGSADPADAALRLRRAAGLVDEIAESLFSGARDDYRLLAQAAWQAHAQRAQPTKPPAAAAPTARRGRRGLAAWLRPPHGGA